ncbi:MAG: DUF1015 family protein [Myxococcales bacterium]|jgi:uncharacterized protein (DUF1015 family)|nr:DUF1015 family protein [Myxococcales bacterium]
MSIVRPFAALRPPADKAAQVSCPPYDVVNSAEAARYAEGNALSFFHVSRPEIDLPGVDEHDDAVYDQAPINLQKFQDTGYLLRDASPCFYLYRQIMDGHAQTGLVACASVDEYQAEKIKKHELTRADKEDDRTRHVDALGGNDEPVFFVYPARASIDAIVARICALAPTYDFTSEDGIQHTLWVVADAADIALIEQEFAAIDTMYIADGHHRSAAASRVRELSKGRLGPEYTGQEEFNFFMTVIFPHDQMHIMDYNRLVKDLAGNTKESFLAKVSDKFEVAKSGEKKPGRTHEFGMYLRGEWFTLTARSGTFDASDPVASLDVSILQENLLSPILGIGNPRTDKRIDFVGGIRGMAELERRVDSGECAVAFAMFPTRIEELIAIADAGKIMPPKSTWFEPKLRSGLFLHTFE